MTERENIWGRPGCELPNGALCNACCILPAIELEGGIISVEKPEFTPCPNLSKDGQGCSLHKTGNKPSSCSWHCSQTQPYHKMELVSQAISTGIVTENEAEMAVARLVNEAGSVNSLEDVLSSVFLHAEYIRGKTKIRPLIYGEPDEP